MALLSASGTLLFAHQLTAIKTGRFPQGRHIKINMHPIMEQKSFFFPSGLAAFKHLLQLSKPFCPIVISRNVIFYR